MNKMEYQKPWAEFVEFENEDIITASGQGEGEQPSGSCPNNGTHWHCFLWGGSWCNETKCETAVWYLFSDNTTPYSLDEGTEDYSGGFEHYNDGPSEW